MRARLSGMRLSTFALAILLPWLSACAAGPYVLSDEEAPAPAREFRAAWIATVHNIDWPSEPGLSVAKQQAELLALLDRAQSLNMNAVVFQIRPTCDALYASELEPWSRYLTGEIGKAPEPFYDPLAFAVREAHARGLELHAWFNPYRARPGKNDPKVAAGHITDPKHPLNHALRPYGELLLLDPGLPEVRAHSTRVILDVVERYDVDAVHMDDYFYPYPDKRPDGSVVPFPDDASYAKFGQGLSRSDWRRQNVNTFVRELQAAVHAQKPWVKVGIAPFGIWRPKHPPSVEGMDAYEAISADTRRWLMEGWVDYLSPQLYWGTYFPEQGFAALATWWEAQNPKGRHMWPGVSSRWIKSKRDPKRDAGEILKQIELVRETVPDVRPGHIHWNLSALVEDRDGIVGALQEGPYRDGALVPESPWLGGETTAALESVEIRRADQGLKIEWEASPSTRWVALQVRASAGAPWQLLGVRRAGATWALPSRPAALALRPLARNGASGPAQVWTQVD
jgi:uncharacterized lipoprotein YddW (UPF0748 family)